MEWISTEETMKRIKNRKRKDENFTWEYINELNEYYRTFKHINNDPSKYLYKL